MADAASPMTWKLTGVLAGTGAGLLMRKLVAGAWRTVRHEEPPENPASPSTSWPDALVWAAVSGVGVAVARLVAQRGAAGAWHARTGHLPAEVRASGAPA